MATRLSTSAAFIIFVLEGSDSFDKVCSIPDMVTEASLDLVKVSNEVSGATLALHEVYLTLYISSLCQRESIIILIHLGSNFSTALVLTTPRFYTRP